MQRVVSDPKVLGGKPIVRGTRISVELLLSLLASGITEDNILREYPYLKRADLRAAIAFAAGIAGGTRIFPSQALPGAVKAS